MLENYVGVSAYTSDYPCRSRDPRFNLLCLWEHEEWVAKVSAASEEKRLERARADRSPKERERWARVMLILFKPCRSVKDLKDSDKSWTAAFARTEFPTEALQIMKNMQVEHECKDGRDAHDALRKAEKGEPLLPDNDGGTSSADVESFVAAMEGDAGLEDGLSDNESEEPEEQSSDPVSLRNKELKNRATEKEVMLVLDRTELWRDRHLICTWTPSEEHTFITTDTTKAQIAQQSEKMSVLAKDKRPLLNLPSGQPPSKRRRLNPAESKEPVTSLEQLNFEEHTIYEREIEIDTISPEHHLQDIIRDFGIADNLEQLRALQIIAEHFMFNGRAVIDIHSRCWGCGEKFRH